MASSFSSRGLFGGAITAVLPDNLTDVSDIRQVPDNQEVFIYPDSNISIVIEILERVEPNADGAAARFHFDSLAFDNSAQSPAVHEIRIIPFYVGVEPLAAIVVEGTQMVPKFRQTELDEVRILMVLYRIQSKNIDLVVTWNVPMKSEDGGAVGDEGLMATRADVERFVGSFKIVDFGLFA